MQEVNLVSIIVISYNSSKTIIETLDSIKMQTYENIELVVADDCSTDDTLKVIELWLIDNEKRFKSVKIVKNKINKGITFNCNSGLKVSEGNYIKLIAADDILLENCIEDLYQTVIKSSKGIVFSKSIPFCDNDDKNIEYVESLIKREEILYKNFFAKNANNQLKDIIMMKIPLSIIIGSFFSMELLKELNYFDEVYEMMEDYPVLFRLSSKGIKFELLNMPTTKYRTRAVTNEIEFKKSKRYISHYNNLKEFRLNEILPYLLKNNKYFLYIYLRVLIKLLDLEYNDDKGKIKNGINFLRKTKKRFLT